MALVIKSWAVTPTPAAGQPYVRIVGREGGLLSFIFSLLGIDTTTTMLLTPKGFEFESGSLSGFLRQVTPYPHLSTLFYGRFKPWKTAGFIIGIGFLLGGSLIGQGTGATVMGTLFILGGLGVALIYYFLNRELTLGFGDDGGNVSAIQFKRSVVEGQEVNEEALRTIIAIVESLVRGEAVSLTKAAAGGSPGSERVAAPAPMSVKEILKPAKSECPSCGARVTPADVFCGGCGHKLAASA